MVGKVLCITATCAVQKIRVKVALLPQSTFKKTKRACFLLLSGLAISKSVSDSPIECSNWNGKLRYPVMCKDTACVDAGIPVDRRI